MRSPKLTVLVCSCGKRLKAPGAVPGRVGRCPACGGMLRVPEGDRESVGASIARPSANPDRPRKRTGADGVASSIGASPEGDEVLPERFGVAPSAYVMARPGDASRKKAGGGGRLVRRPDELETTLAESLLYPLWDETGLALLAILPPALWLTSLPLIGILPALVRGLGLLSVLAPFALPMGLFWILVVGYTLLFLGQVLVTSAAGEVRHPRLPSWDVWEIVDGLGRWLWAGVFGFALGGFPALVYWVRCGDVDWLDRIIFAELLALGAVYALMALVAAMLHGSAWAANPITVLSAIGRVGWPYARPCLQAGGTAAIALGVLVLAYGASSPWLAAVGFGTFWVVAFYGAMVVLRVLGLFCRRHREALGWDVHRPRWGA